MMKIDAEVSYMHICINSKHNLSEGDIVEVAVVVFKASKVEINGLNTDQKVR